MRRSGQDDQNRIICPILCRARIMLTRKYVFYASVNLLVGLSHHGLFLNYIFACFVPYFFSIALTSFAR